jgi:hypothetical protein
MKNGFFIFLIGMCFAFPSQAIELADMYAKFSAQTHYGTSTAPVSQKILIPEGKGTLVVKKTHKPWQDGRTFFNSRTDSVLALACKNNYTVCSGESSLGYALTQSMYVGIQGFEALPGSYTPDPWVKGQQAHAVEQYRFTTASPGEMIIRIYPQISCGLNSCYQYASESWVTVEWLPEGTSLGVQTRYDAQTGLLTIPKLAVGNDFYYVQLDYHGDGFFSLYDVVRLAASDTSEYDGSFYDARTGFLSLPRVRVGSRDYYLGIEYYGDYDGYTFFVLTEMH